MEIQYRHLFECITPPMPDEIVYRKHPTVPITVTNASYVLLNEDAPMQLQYNLGKPSFQTSNYKRFLIYGAFHPEEIPSIAMIYPINGNPYDNRIENLVSTAGKSFEVKKIILDEQKKFTKETVREMLKREKEIGSSVDLVSHFCNLGVPHTFAKAWMKVSPWCKENGIDIKMSQSTYTSYPKKEKAARKALEKDEEDIF